MCQIDYTNPKMTEHPNIYILTPISYLLVQWYGKFAQEKKILQQECWVCEQGLI